MEVKCAINKPTQLTAIALQQLDRKSKHHNSQSSHTTKRPNYLIAWLQTK